MEIYKPIKNFEDTYYISNLGNVKSIKTNKILKNSISTNGYKTIFLRIIIFLRLSLLVFI
jgi:hypothetical protein